MNINPKYKIGMFAKDKIDKGSSNLAQGGIAAEIDFNPEKLPYH